MNDEKRKTVVEEDFDADDLNKELKKPKQHYAFISTAGGFSLFLIVVFCSVWFPNQTPQKKMQEDVKQYIIAVQQVNPLNAAACFSVQSSQQASDEFTAYYSSELTKGFLEALGSRSSFMVDNMQVTSQTEGFVPMELTATDWGSLVSAGILTESEVEAVFGGAQTLTEVLSRDGCAEVFEKLRASAEAGTLPTVQSVIQAATVKDEESGPWKIIFTEENLLETVGDWTVLR